MEVSICKWPYADHNEIQAVNKVLSSGCWWRNAGKEVKLFEKEFSTYQDSLYAVSTSNGTVAIEIALRALGIGKGDEVIIPAFTFYSTLSAVLAVDAIPVIVDVLNDTFCIDPQKVECAITNKTKAIIAVHIAGQMADMDALVNICNKYAVYLIEDAAHAHGASWKNQKAGSMSTCATFSFQNAKLITAGEGGIIVSNNAQLIHDCFLYTNCGREENDTNYLHKIIGTNARLSEIQGAILRIQLQRLNEQMKIREDNYRHFEKLIGNVGGIKMQNINENITCHSHYMVMFYFDSEYFGKSREQFLEYLRTNGVPCNRAYSVIYSFPLFNDLSEDEYRIHLGICPNAESISKGVVCIPHNVLLGDYNTMNNLVELIKRF